MQSNTVTLTASANKSWMKIENYSTTDGVESRNLACLFIGKENAINDYDPYFKTISYVDNFSAAESFITSSAHSLLPDAIFIDLPLNISNINHFYNFLRQFNLDTRAVIIYNEARIDSSKIKAIKAGGLVDDVLPLNSADINYASKVMFLKRIKTRMAGLSATRELIDGTDNFTFKGSMAKRSMDVLLAGSAIILLSPVFLLVMLAIRLESSGPVIYTSNRAGKGWRVFKFFKFRTMQVGADQRIDEFSHLNQYQSATNAKFIKINNDPRITKVGRILRKTSLDELPQFFNVLKGDMSLVGNRPLPLYEASTLTTNEFVERFAAPAGITGLWQIKKRGKNEMSTEERISLDISYARKANVAFDLWIMAKTPTVLFQKSNG